MSKKFPFIFTLFFSLGLMAREYVDPRYYLLDSLKMKESDQFYMFSDGYPDQFGAPKGNKFMHKAFKNLVAHNSQKELSTQKTTLESTFNEWKGIREQIEGVPEMGFRI